MGNVLCGIISKVYHAHCLRARSIEHRRRWRRCTRCLRNDDRVAGYWMSGSVERREVQTRGAMPILTSPLFLCSCKARRAARARPTNAAIASSPSLLQWPPDRCKECVTRRKFKIVLFSSISALSTALLACLPILVNNYRFHVLRLRDIAR